MLERGDLRVIDAIYASLRFYTRADRPDLETVPLETLIAASGWDRYADVVDELVAAERAVVKPSGGDRAAAGPAVEAIAVALDGPRLRCPPTGTILCTLDPATGRWLDPDGALVEALGLPTPRLTARLAPGERSRARRARDAAWLQASLPAVRRLAERHATLTSDEVWAALDQPPSEPRQVGQLMRAAVAWIEPTDEHRPSRRPTNHRRPVRVWRSRLLGTSGQGALPV